MNSIEDRLARELGAIADGAGAPHVDVAGVRRVAGRERGRRRGLVVAGVSVAVIVVGVLATAGAPRVTGDRIEAAGTTGAAPLRLAWSEGDTVHLPSGRTIRLPQLDGVFFRGGTTLVGYGDTPGGSWALVDDTGARPALVQLVGGGVLGTPVLSLGGDHVAWTVQDGRGLEVTSFDVATARPVTIGLGAGDGDGVFSGVTGVDDQGRVLVDRGSAAQLLWTPGSEPRPVVADRRPGYGFALLPGGRAVAYAGEDLEASLWSLPSIGDAKSVSPLDQVAIYGFNDDASAYVVTRPQPRLVTLAADGTTHEGAVLMLPESGVWEPVGWETRTDVVLRHDTDLVRCSVTTNTCEELPSEGVGEIAGF